MHQGPLLELPQGQLGRRRHHKGRPSRRSRLRGNFETPEPRLGPHRAAALPGSVIPEETWEQVVQLVAEADSIAGGDARRFMDEYLRELEQVGTSGRAANEDPGNAPPYPVLYVAEILRGNEVMTLRGETQPYGQYSIFKPSDGEVLAVYFYDPRTRRIGIATPRHDPKTPRIPCGASP